jgi:hypothetical protein
MACVQIADQHFAASAAAATKSAPGAPGRQARQLLRPPPASPPGGTAHPILMTCVLVSAWSWLVQLRQCRS